MNIKTLISTGVVAAALVLAGPAASYAAVTPEPTPTAPAAVDTTDAAVLNQLHELEGKQSAAEIAQVSASSPASVLLDAATGKPLAAVKTAVKISPLLYWTSPGCTAAGACVYANNGATALGFSGSGQLDFAMSSVTKFYAGTQNTTLWRNLDYWAAAAYNTAYLSGPVNMTAITRS